jgi:hypothetical protein
MFYQDKVIESMHKQIEFASRAVASETLLKYIEDHGLEQSDGMAEALGTVAPMIAPLLASMLNKAQAAAGKPET